MANEKDVRRRVGHSFELGTLYLALGQSRLPDESSSEQRTKYKEQSTDYLSRDRFSLQLLRLIVGDECVDERIEVAFHNQIELMNRQADAVIRDPVFLEVVRTNFLGAIAGADHRAAFAGLRFVLLLFFEFLETRTQHAHRLFAILDLRLLVLHGNYNVRRQVCDSHGGVSRVD